MTAICGMIGEVAREPESAAHLTAMLDVLGSRERAQWTAPDGRCRLAIAGRCGPRQPRVASHMGLVAVYDGQVFDGPECVLRSWVDRGPRGLTRVDSQFAAAIWDPRKRRLALIRDALGVRSLYLHASAYGVVFASSIEALLRHPAVPLAVDERAVSQFLTFLDVPAPRTLFDGITKLPPGTLAEYDLDGSHRSERVWELVDDPLPPRDDAAYYVEKVRRLHHDALAARMTRAPMAALLSGGNDSSANVALMAKLGVSQLHTFTVGLAGFEGSDRYSDLVHARRVAKLVGTTHHEHLLSVDEFIAAMPAVTDSLDDLVSEPSSVFLHHALRMVRDRGLDVVITGEGNDEISCGHQAMVRIRDGYYRRFRPLARLPRSVRRLLAAVAPIVSPRHADVLARAADGEEYFSSFEIGWGDRDKAQILTREALARVGDVTARAIVDERARAIRRIGHANDDYLAYVIAMMMQDHYLGNLMLGKLEQLSSRLGIEARCPYTAPAYVHFVYNIPSQFKTTRGNVKTFFKDAIRDTLLPADVVDRPKQGFRTPTVELFKGRFGSWAEPFLLDRGLTQAGILRRDTLASTLAAHRSGRRDLSTRLWTALVLNLWHERWMKRPALTPRREVA